MLSSIQSLTRVTKLFLDLNITVDGKCENIFELSRYDELPDLEDYHPSDTKNSLTSLKQRRLGKSKENLPICISKCDENIQEGQTFSSQGELRCKPYKPKILKSKYLMKNHNSEFQIILILESPEQI